MLRIDLQVRCGLRNCLTPSWRCLRCCSCAAAPAVAVATRAVAAEAARAHKARTFFQGTQRPKPPCARLAAIKERKKQGCQAHLTWSCDGRPLSALAGHRDRTRQRRSQLRYENLTAWTRKMFGKSIQCFAMVGATTSKSLRHVFGFLDIRCPREACEPHRLD